MKKVLKYLAIVLGFILVLVIGFAAFVGMAGIPTYETADFEYHVEATPEKIERGEKLVTSLCASCHKSSKTGKLTGTRMLDAPAEFGTIFSPNITQDKEFGIGDWTDAELLYLLRTGIKKDGVYAPPYMAKLPTMADEDIESIIAFLRSDHPLVAADNTPDVPTQPSFLTKMLCRMVMKPFPMPENPIPMPDTTNQVEWGEYLAHNLDCFSCHSADFKSNNYLEPELSPGYFGGGNKTLNKQGQLILTSNLTPHKETGIGDYSEVQFIKAVKYGVMEGEPNLRYPMLPYSALSDQEVAAIYAYLQTIPPIENKVERMFYEQ